MIKLTYTLTFLLLFILTVTPQSNQRGNGLAFTTNKGQLIDIKEQPHPEILFKGQGNGVDIYLRKTGISYVLSDMDQVQQKVNEKLKRDTKENIHDEQQKRQKLLLKEKLNLCRIDLDFVGCNLNTNATTADQVEGYTNYYLGHCPQGVTNVYSYNQVTQKNIYNNIDVKYYGGKQEGLKYDIIVNPGGDPNNIKLKYSGAESVKIKDGKLQIETSLGNLGEYIPKVYQNISGRIIDVKAEYVLSTRNVVTFKIENYNPTFSLIIDPWVTYYGGNSWDGDGSLTKDKSGNVIFTGYSSSTNFPISSGALQTTYSTGANQVGVLVKFTGLGTRVFATYFGGSINTWTNGVATDTANNIVLTGVTSSTNLPTLNPGGGAYTQTNAPSEDAFIAQFSPTGNLIWSTYYGGADNDWGNDVAIDVNNNIVMTGYTRSGNFPTQSPYQANWAGDYDAFVVKFNNKGVRQWATYYGGSSDDRGRAIETDTSGNILLGGFTYSTNFPIFSAHQATFQYIDGFIAKLTGNSGFPIWSTYYGGSNYEEILSIAIDDSNNVYAGGIAKSYTNISTPGAFQTTKGNSGNPDDIDAIVVKFNSLGVRQWGTYLGGLYHDDLGGLSLDINGNLVIAGNTFSTNFPITSCSYKTTFTGYTEQYVTILSTSGNKLICSGFVSDGGTSNYNNGIPREFGGSVVTDGCYVYILAMSRCAYPVTSNAFQTTCDNNRWDKVLAKLYLSSCGGVNSGMNFTASDTTFCASQTIDFTSKYSSCYDTIPTKYLWTFQGGTPDTSSLQNPIGIMYNSSGSYDVKLVIEAGCIKDSLIKTGYIKVGQLSLAVDTIQNVSCTFGNNGTATITPSLGTSPYTYSWSNGVSGITSGLISATGLSAATYTVSVTDNCLAVSTHTVTITEPTILFISNIVTTNATTCAAYNGKAVASATGGKSPYQYTWSTGASGSTTLTLHNGITYTVTVTDANNCKATSTTTVGCPTGVSEYETQELVFGVNPNPATSILTVTLFSNSQYAMKLYDVLGNQVNEIQFNENKYDIDVSDFSSGIYFIELTDKRKNISARKKVIIR